MKKKLFMQILFLVTLLAVLCFDGNAAAKAADMTDIRVGLTELYCGVSSVTIYNETIALGYCINNSFKTEQTFTGSSGFTFTAAAGIFYVSTETYSSYAQAKSAAQSIKALGADAYAAVLNRGEWRVYVSGKSERDAAMRDLKIVLEAGILVSDLSADNGHRVLVTGKDDIFIIDGKPNNIYPQIKAVSKNKRGDYILNLGSRQYRGRLEIGRYGANTLSVVNILNVEAYLKSVVPCEMTSSWHEEALKAQAVCARSYALAADTSFGITNPYTLVDTIRSQVYRGYTYENVLTSAAVLETKGIVVRYKGKIIPAYFFSTSGGATENGMDVWGLTQACFAGVPDLFETSPERQPWIVKTTYAKLREMLANNGISTGAPTRVYSKITTASGRILELAINSGSQSVTIASDDMRTILGLPSTKVKVVNYGDKPDDVYMQSSAENSINSLSGSYAISASGISQLDESMEQFIAISDTNMMNFPCVSPQNESEIYFAGMGYGHGVGMSQSGARGMAEQGYTYKEIVEYYFKGAVCGG